jgi:hypothetical protein
MSNEQLTSFSEMDAPTTAHEEVRSGRLLQDSQLLGYRGWRHVNRRSGGCNRPPAGDFAKKLDTLYV